MGEIVDTLVARIAELENALRSCLVKCEACGTFATQEATTPQASYRVPFCDRCAEKRKPQLFETGRLVGKPVYGHWQPMKRNVELTRIYATSASVPTGSEAPR